MEFYKTNKRNFGIYPWGSRVSARVIDSSSRAAISVDGVVSVDGIPVSPKRAREAERERQRWRMKKIKTFVCYNYLSVIWVSFCGILYFVLQGLT